jgi:hypothetical protein
MNSTVHVDLWSWSIWSPGDGVESAYGRAALGRFVQLLMGRSVDLVEDLPATHRRCGPCHYCDGNPALLLQGVEETRNNCMGWIRDRSHNRVGRRICFRQKTAPPCLPAQFHPLSMQSRALPVRHYSRNFAGVTAMRHTCGVRKARRCIARDPHTPFLFPARALASSREEEWWIRCRGLAPLNAFGRRSSRYKAALHASSRLW